jgi:hypothetical protein
LLRTDPIQVLLRKWIYLVRQLMFL